ncbi:hypothetical protein AMAG_02093 [Allomyces macrogynus ATCC 38327]|uniref:Uncharacterized protein n=1 Tax=Allomyces macrogynus (strain ATCC 38327) TaxID=578462 RepID=A0A0L0S136_ALLM3|nr:hypothetical protein AMAG_02093 [Allomyces macrogynus ATCC 38327]|eukprot:KNE56263.1 hypothetical protein AMAG_02093 [Allomyces macrogynus ATCC 38327]
MSTTSPPVAPPPPLRLPPLTALQHAILSAAVITPRDALDEAVDAADEQAEPCDVVIQELARRARAQLEQSGWTAQHAAKVLPSAWTWAAVLDDPAIGVEAAIAHTEKNKWVDLCLDDDEADQDRHDTSDSESAVVATNAGLARLATINEWAAEPEPSAIVKELQAAQARLLDRLGHQRTLEQEHAALLAALGEETSEEDVERAMAQHIKNLHSYNEFKDLAQLLFGQLAARQSITVRQVYEDLGISDSDDERGSAA